MSDDYSSGGKIRAHCATCKGDRNCEIKGHYSETGSIADENIYWEVNWFILMCCGCDHVFCQTIATDSERIHQYYDRNGTHVVEQNEVIDTWPARSKRQVPEWFEHGTVETDIPNTRALASSLSELYGALDNEIRVLSSIGIRTSFDIAAGLLGVGSEKSFREKLDDLVAQHHITEADKVHIETLVDAGSAAAHRGWKPTFDDIDVLMTALENFIYNAMIVPARKRAHESKLADLKKKVPERKARGKKATRQALHPNPTT